jgi:hypothetical protein
VPREYCQQVPQQVPRQVQVARQRKICPVRFIYYITVHAKYSEILDIMVKCRLHRMIENGYQESLTKGPRTRERPGDNCRKKIS